MARSGWSVDPKTQVATHDNGLRVQLAGGEVIDILAIPRGLPTRDLPGLLEQAEKAWAAHGRRSAATAVIPPGEGPRRSTLSLKRGEA